MEACLRCEEGIDGGQVIKVTRSAPQERKGLLVCSQKMSFEPNSDRAAMGGAVHSLFGSLNCISTTESDTRQVLFSNYSDVCRYNLLFFPFVCIGHNSFTFNPSYKYLRR